MKNLSLLTLILASTASLCANEIAATYPAQTPSTAMATPSPEEAAPQAQRIMTDRIMVAFKNALKANNAAGSCVVNSPSGNTIASFADISDTYSKTALAAPALDKRSLSASSKAFTSSYFGMDSLKVSDRDIAMHNAATHPGAVGNFTNLAGGMVLRNSKGEPMATIGITAINANGQDISSKVATDVAQQLQGNTNPPK